MKRKMDRREFLKLSGLIMGGALLPEWVLKTAVNAQELPLIGKLGRICAGDEGASFEVKTEPFWEAPTKAYVWRDEVVEWKSEVVSKRIDYNRYNQKWVQTSDGYIYAPYVQPVKNIINTPLSELPVTSTGERGMWVEITAPVVDIIPAVTPSSYWIREALKPRVYYSQVFWAVDLRNDNGKVEYRLLEKYGAAPDTYWVDATACRPISVEEVTPISPDRTDKRIEVDLNYQNSFMHGGE